jgi:hypothetical protein
MKQAAENYVFILLRQLRWMMQDKTSENCEFGTMFSIDFGSFETNRTDTVQK